MRRVFFLRIQRSFPEPDPTRQLQALYDDGWMIANFEFNADEYVFILEKNT